jgi:hypothetical protein
MARILGSVRAPSREREFNPCGPLEATVLASVPGGRFTESDVVKLLGPKFDRWAGSTLLRLVETGYVERDHTLYEVTAAGREILAATK